METLSTRGISAGIERQLREAKQFMLFFSPYLKISDSLYERIVDRLDEGIRTIFLYGKKEGEISRYGRLIEHAMTSVFYLDQLHAKAYMNERGMIVTSMNLHSYSEINNWELGLFFEYGSKSFRDIRKEIMFMLKAARHEYGNSDLTVLHPDHEIDLLVGRLNGRFANLAFEKQIQED